MAETTTVGARRSACDAPTVAELITEVSQAVSRVALYNDQERPQAVRQGLREIAEKLEEVRAMLTP